MRAVSNDLEERRKNENETRLEMNRQNKEIIEKNKGQTKNVIEQQRNKVLVKT